ncbi:MAG: transglycosylase SLT domain-containing protein [Bacteroidia bacterium]|nr:transglycosylase SLT domain-containing protein [Bacteroidia bacterium]
MKFSMGDKMADFGGIFLANVFKLPVMAFFLLVKSATVGFDFMRQTGMPWFRRESVVFFRYVFRKLKETWQNISFKNIHFEWKWVAVTAGGVSAIAFVFIGIDFQGFYSPGKISKRLYLIENADPYIEDTGKFEEKVVEVAATLDVPPEWLMAVMYSESRLNPSVINRRGSGATGLIQFMVPTVRELNDRLGTNYYMSDIRKMEAHDQMELVREYLQTVRERYGEYDSLTDLYLAILYPKALEYGTGYTLYSKPTKMYNQNIGLDENKDGSVTVSDISERMKRLFPTAFYTPK